MYFSNFGSRKLKMEYVRMPRHSDQSCEMDMQALFAVREESNACSQKLYIFYIDIYDLQCRASNRYITLHHLQNCFKPELYQDSNQPFSQLHTNVHCRIRTATDVNGKLMWICGLLMLGNSDCYTTYTVNSEF